MTTHTTFEAGMPEHAQKLLMRYASEIGEALVHGQERYAGGPFVVAVNTDIHAVVAMPTDAVRKALAGYPYQETVDVICEECPPGSVRVFFWNSDDNQGIMTVRAFYSTVTGKDVFPLGMMSKHKGSA